LGNTLGQRQLKLGTARAVECRGRATYLYLPSRRARSASSAAPNLTGRLWTLLIERISRDRRSRRCGEIGKRARSRSCWRCARSRCRRPRGKSLALAREEAEISEQRYYPGART